MPKIAEKKTALLIKEYVKSQSLDLRPVMVVYTLTERNSQRITLSAVILMGLAIFGIGEDWDYFFKNKLAWP